MGKNNDVPAVPDYAGAAEAQAQGSSQNIEQQTWANRMNQQTPWGSVNYSSQPVWDPVSGQWINQWTQNTQLTPTLDAAQQAQQNIALGRSNMGVDLLNGAAAQVTTPVDWNKFPQGPQSLQGGNIATGFQGGGPSLPGSVPQAGQLQTGISGAGSLQRGVGVTGAQTSVAGGGPIASGFAPGFGIQTDLNQTGLIQNQGPGMGGPIDNRANELQRGLNYNPLGDISGLGHGEAARQAVTDAMYQQMASRLDPRWSKRMESMQTDLYNTGLRPGDAGYNEAMNEQGRQMNDAYNQAMLSSIQGGIGAQQAEFGMNLGARQQGVGEINTQGQFANAATGQAFQQALGAGQFQQGLNQQGFNQGLSQAQLQNASNLAMGQFANAAQAQQYGQNLGQAQFQNQAQLQQFQQNLAQGQFANAGLQQQFGQGLAAGQFANAAQAQQFQQNAAEQQAYNQALAQQYAMGLQGTQMQASLNQQGFNQAQAQAAFGNQAAAQQLQQQQALAAYQNQMRQQAINEALMQQGWNLNLINSAMSGQQVAMPQMPGFSQAGVAQAPNYLGAAQAQQQGNMDAWSAQQAQNNSWMGAIGQGMGALGALAPFAFSDERLKNHIIRYQDVQLIPGVPLATWEWKGQPGYRVAGVVAQDLEKVAPKYVRVHPNGYKMVDYSFLRHAGRIPPVR